MTAIPTNYVKEEILLAKFFLILTHSAKFKNITSEIEYSRMVQMMNVPESYKSKLLSELNTLGLDDVWNLRSNIQMLKNYILRGYYFLNGFNCFTAGI